jgi:hypothetical protein
MTDLTLPTCRFQSFSEPSDPKLAAGRVAALRKALPLRGSTASSSRAPTNIRANMSRPIWPASHG